MQDTGLTILMSAGESTATALPETIIRETTGDDSPVDQDDWYCIKVRIVCGCGRYFDYATVSHLIIVWPDKDDEHLLRMCQGSKKRGLKVQVKTYEESMGPCVSWYAIDARGLQPCT